MRLMPSHPYLLRLFRVMLDQLYIVNPAVSDLHRDWLRSTSSGAVQQTYGTMCSGSEAPVLVINAFNEVAGYTAQHLFSCEIEPWKAAFIKDAFDVPAVFKDVKDLKHGTAPCWRAECHAPVRSANGVLAGFCCDDVSSRNPKQKSSAIKGSKGKSSSKTGATFWGIINYCRKHEEVDWLVLENVKGLSRPSKPGKDNDGAVKKRPAASPQHVKPPKLFKRQYGIDDVNDGDSTAAGEPTVVPGTPSVLESKNKATPAEGFHCPARASTAAVQELSAAVGPTSTERPATEKPQATEKPATEKPVPESSGAKGDTATEKAAPVSRKEKAAAKKKAAKERKENAKEKLRARKAAAKAKKQVARVKLQARKKAAKDKAAAKKGSAFQQAVTHLTKEGFWVFRILLDTTRFKSFASRTRYWFVCIKKRLLDLAGVPPEVMENLAQELFEIAQRGHEDQPEHEVLLDECDPRIRTMLRDLKNKFMSELMSSDFDEPMEPRKPGIDPATGNPTKWEAYRETCFKAHNLSWPPTVQKMKLCKDHPGMLDLKQRDYEILYYFGLHKYDPAEKKILDTTQKLHLIDVRRRSCFEIGPAAHRQTHEVF